MFKRLGRIQDRILDLETNVNDMARCINGKLERIEQLESKIDALQRQVKCGVTGHNLEFVKVYEPETIWTTMFFNSYARTGFNVNKDGTATDPAKGVFKCSKCGLEIVRRLKPAEITAAKKLGLIK